MVNRKENKEMIGSLFARIVSENPEHVAVVDGDKRLTYQELYSREKAFVRYLINEFKINKDERVGALLPNCVEFMVAFLAVAEIGAVFMPLNIQLTERELQYYMVKCGITALIVNSQYHGRWIEICGKSRERRIVTADRPDATKGPENNSLYEARALDRLEENSPDTDVLFLSTSGSTGRPKIVPRTQNNLVAGAKNAAEAIGVTREDRFLSVKNAAEAIGVTREDRFLSVVPFHHANGFCNCMFLPMMSGATVVMMKEFSARKMLDILQKENITVFFGSPFIFSVISEIAEKGQGIPVMRACFSSGAPMSEDLRKTFFRKFGIKIQQLYGSSEMGTVSIELGDEPEAQGSVGRPLKAVDVKIVSRGGKELAAYETGEIIVKSPAMTNGYIDEPELNKTAFDNGYFRTGDFGMLDACGFLHISGRKDRVINAGGVKVDPVEIENVLLSFHKVKEAFVFGIKNRRGMEIIKAIIVAQADCKLNEVMGYCKGRLADYKIPRIVDFRDEIPKDMMGKVLPT
jgi:long-chain acyl-CoA synthetase